MDIVYSNVGALQADGEAEFHLTQKAEQPVLLRFSEVINESGHRFNPLLS